MRRDISEKSLKKEEEAIKDKQSHNFDMKYNDHVFRNKDNHLKFRLRTLRERYEITEDYFHKKDQNGKEVVPNIKQFNNELNKYIDKRTYIYDRENH